LAEEDQVGAVFAALADPTRRHLVETLARRSGATPTSLAAELPITRQAVAKHLRALSDAGIVAYSRAGRETRYELTPEALAGVTGWLATVGAEWDERLQRLEVAVRRRSGPAGS
jgi:DNA-binding transcriptional ArsR family regulator